MARPCGPLQRLIWHLYLVNVFDITMVAIDGLEAMIVHDAGVKVGWDIALMSQRFSSV
jgi:hypothetical protein